MAAVPIPFPVTSAPGKNPHDSAGRLINCYHEPLVSGARSRNVWRRAPGLKSFNLATYSGWRGGLVVGNLLYAAFSGSGGKVVNFASDGTETLMGPLAGTKKLFWARNNKAPSPDVVVVDPDNGASVVTSAPAVSNYPDTDVGSPNSVCFLDGYFFFTYGDGTCIASAINDTSIDPLDFVKTEGNPNGLLRAIPFGELYLCGANSIEPYSNTGNATGFPFTRVKIIPRGILGRYAVCGHEPGFGKGLFFVGDDKIVYYLDGYNPTKVSTPDVDRAIASFIENGGSVDDVEMYPYVVDGHSCIVLRTPSWTWVLDVDTLHWHERESHLLANFRAFGSVNAFDKWLVGDSQTNNVMEITEGSKDEMGSAIRFDIYSGPVSDFPNRVICDQASFDIARGVGIATGADPEATEPVVYISWSDDGGLSWSVPVKRDLGAQHTSPAPVRVNRAGLTKDEGRRWRLFSYAPVDIELTGASMKARARVY